MNKEYFIFHPHSTPEEDKKVKYHIDELVKRDFLHNRSKSGIERLLIILEQGKKIYEKNNKFYVYKKAIKELDRKY